MRAFPVFPVLLTITVVVLGIVITSEMFAPGLITEGFESAAAGPEASYWSTFAAPRNDIGPDKEDPGYIRDSRFFNSYADVTRIGASYDFCRMIAPKANPTNFFFSCALAATDGLDSAEFRTASMKEGFKSSHDDYMRDINGDGRDDYCRILKWTDGSWQPQCLRSTDTGFDSKNVVDPQPPDDIQKLLRFYQDCIIWLRFFGDMTDSIGSVKVHTAGGLKMDETAHKSITQGVSFQANQYLRISDSNDLSLGTIVPMRSVRAWMVWVKFDEFTNNAKIFDFGNGKEDNVFLGILAKGDPDLDQDFGESTVPTAPSGAQPVSEMSPQRLLLTGQANVEEWQCKGPELLAKKVEPLFPKRTKSSTKATLLYEVWDKQSRKMRIKVNSIIPLGKWIHLAIVADSNDAFRPNITVYVNGEAAHRKPSGFLPSTSKMTNCYLGKSNWANAVSQYENRDELFKGSMFDFRAYQATVSQDLIQESYLWGKDKLGLL
jgi:hypothetical protein